ncbi:MAG TPA: choice-of-anchor J domain-containing protein, partial [Bacteroidales bacterium]|nr:choice-of-anchor J domain-containing protein [Bacteroidales bacterium]
MRIKILIVIFLFLSLPPAIAQKPGTKNKQLPVKSLNNGVEEFSSAFLKSATEDETILLDEGFEGEFTGWTYINNDEDDYYWGLYEENEEYDYAHTGNFGLAVFFNGTEPNDDWLLIPQIKLPDDADRVDFSFWASSHSPEYPESFNVKLSTTDNKVDDFTIDLETVAGAPAAWTQYSCNLDEYIGDSVYIAIQCVSEDKWALFVDDFLMVAAYEGQTDDWAAQNITLYNTSEAEIVARNGDIDNMGFGWASDFNPFSGASTGIHAFPWSPDEDDAPGTDRIMVVSSYDGNPPDGSDGYTTSTTRPENLPEPITITYDLKETTINAATLQLFVDDFQAPSWGAQYQITIDNVRAPFLENVINSLSQAGPVGKMITVSIPPEFYPYLADGEFSLLIDDPITGAGDGYAIDFVKLLINPETFTYTGTITGVVIDNESEQPISNAVINASGITETTSNADGTFTLNDLPAGINHLTITADGYQSTNTNVDLKSDETENINVRLEPAIEVPDILSAEYGPPSQSNTWTHYTVPLTASAFGVDQATFEQAMQQIEMIRIRTEMHTGNDEGGIDQVSMGIHTASFDSGTEGWGAMGDGTMRWKSSGGYDGGYIAVSDWATGEWHWAVAPESWTGDLSGLVGEDFSFYFMTNQPSYEAYVEFHTSGTERIVLSSENEMIVAGSVTPLNISLVPAPENDVTVSLSSSNPNVLTVPDEVVIDASGNGIINMAASSEIDEETTCVVTVNAPGYSKSRITITIAPRPDAIISTSKGGYWNEPSTWIGGVVPTKNDNVVIDGTVILYSRNNPGYAANLTINENDSLIGDSSDGIFDAGIVHANIHGTLTNNGVITNGNAVLSLNLYANIHNHGLVNCSSLIFYGDSKQTISMDKGAVFDVFRLTENDIESSVELASDVTLKNTSIEMREFFNQGELPGTIIIPEGANHKLILDNCRVRYTNIDGNGNSLSGQNNSRLYEKNTFSDLKLEGTFEVEESITFAGDSVVLSDTLNGNYRYDTIYAESKLIHYGYMPYNSPAVAIKDDFVNSGDWASDHTYVAGTSEQTIVFKDNAVHYDKRGVILQANTVGASSFKWNKDGKDLQDATKNNLELENLDSHNNGIYNCETDVGASRNIILDISYPGLVAEFKAEATTGIAPLTLQFTSESKGYPDDWKWEIANDGESQG